MNLASKSDVELADYVISQVIVPGMSPEEAANAVNDYLCYRMRYDLNYYTVFDSIVNGIGRCQGYANAFKCVMERLGVPTHYCSGIGYTDGTSGSHAWNRSLINGKYYYTDVCWNDYRKQSTDDYLLLTYEEMSKDHLQEDVIQGYAQ